MSTYPATGIEKLQSILHEKIWIMMTFYGDESGTHDKLGASPGADVIGVAGYLGWDNKWKSFDTQWRECLDRYKVKDFHMARFLREKEWSYRGWSDEKRKQFINELIKIAHQHTTLSVGGLVVLKDYNEIVPNSIKREHKHPYYFCFQMLIDTLLPELKNCGLPVGQKVAFIFDQNQQFADGAVASFKIIKAFRDKQDQLGSINFHSRTDCIPLQAADLIVYSVRDHLSRVTKEKPLAEWIAQLRKQRNQYIGFVSRDNLRKYVEDIQAAKMQQAIQIAGQRKRT